MTTWGTAVKNSSFTKGNIQLGYDITRSAVDYNTTEVTWTLNIYLGAQYAISDSSNRLNVTGSFPNRSNYSQTVSIPSSGGSGAYATQLVYSESVITYGGSGTTHSVSFSASMSYLYEYQNTTAASVSGSDSVYIDYPPVNPPSAPQSFAADTATFGQIGLSWSAPSNNGGGSITSYVLRNGSTILQNSGATSYVHTGLQPYTDYSYSVTAVNSAGEGTQATLTAKTMGGVANIKKSTTGYDKVVPKVRVDGAWVLAPARIRDNGQWKYGI